MSLELLQQISQRKTRLDELNKHLKSLFFGIDQEIDKIVESMKSWYLVPDILTSPIIINLWSLTGHGKTALVRAIVEFLDYKDKFCEVQLSDSVTTDSPSSLAEKILKAGIGERKPGIILLDEFQRYKTIDNNGETIRDLPYQDIWMLLSDGKFPIVKDYAKDYQDLLRDFYFTWKSRPVDKPGNSLTPEPSDSSVESPNKTEEDEEMEFGAGSYTMVRRSKDIGFNAYNEHMVSRFQQCINYSLTKEEIFKMTYFSAGAYLEDYNAKRKSTFDFTKCLIFVCGNLDQAYPGSTDVDDCDMDADVYHTRTRKVSIIEIKQALGARFKPEQISRLGNNHIVYPSLNKSAYMSIIEDQCNKCIEQSTLLSGVQFSIEQNLIKQIYDNAVFPSQGTRPVFSTIHMMFGCPMANGILWALTNSYNSLQVDIDVAKSSLVFKHGEDTLYVPIDFQLKIRKDRHTEAFQALVSVHEVGHAIVYSKLFKKPPASIKINIASFDGGYNMLDEQFPSAQDVLDNICVGLAGIVAEEIVFGEGNRSTGSASDLLSCTSQAGQYYRRWAMGTKLAVQMKDQSSLYVHNLDESDKHIEKLLKEQKSRCNRIMMDHHKFLLTCSMDLLQRKEFTRAEFREYARSEFNFESSNKDESKIDTTSDYAALLYAAAEAKSCKPA